MDWAATIELLKQPEIVIMVIIVIILLFTTSIGKMVIKKVTAKYFGKEDELCTLEEMIKSPILIAYINSVTEKKVAKMEKINEIYRFDRIRESHVKIKELSDAIQRCMLNHFRTLVTDHRERRQYALLLNKSFEPGEEEMMEYVKRNGLLDKSEESFSAYTKKTAERVISITTEDIDDLYYDDDFSITREDLKSSDYNTIRRDISDMIEDTLREIREIFRRKDEEIKRIEEE